MVVNWQCCELGPSLEGDLLAELRCASSGQTPRSHVSSMHTIELRALDPPTVSADPFNDPKPDDVSPGGIVTTPEGTCEFTETSPVKLYTLPETMGFGVSVLSFDPQNGVMNLLVDDETELSPTEWEPHAIQYRCKDELGPVAGPSLTLRLNQPPTIEVVAIVDIGNDELETTVFDPV